jgi:hypothetical protein
MSELGERANGIAGYPLTKAKWLFLTLHALFGRSEEEEGEVTSGEPLVSGEPTSSTPHHLYSSTSTSLFDIQYSISDLSSILAFDTCDPDLVGTR